MDDKWDDVEVPDFSAPPERPTAPKPFKIDGVVYECAPVLPAGATRDLAKLASMHKTNNLIGMIEVLGNFMDAIMLESSAKEFAARIRSADKPIDDEQIGRIVVWLLKEYSGGRPTEPS